MVRLALAIFLMCTPPAVAREVYRGDVLVNVGGADVPLPMVLDVEAPFAASDPMIVSILASAAVLLNPLGVLLEDEVAGMSNACERTVSTTGVDVSMAKNRLSIGGQLKAVFRICGLVKMDVGQETGDVRLAVAPGVTEGRLTFSLAGCRVANLDALAQLFNVEQRLCAKAAAFLVRVSADPKVVEPPLGLAEIGYRYTGIQMFQAGRHAFLIGELQGPNDMFALVDFLSAVRDAE